jgi:heme/copper-type cytochrome/quinol oxidase subunit 3
MSAEWAGRRAPVDEAGISGPGWWGAVLGVVVLATGVASVAGAYLYLRYAAPEWPPTGVELPAVWPGAVAAGLAVVSAGIAWRGLRALRRGATRVAMLALAAAIALGLSAVAIEAVEMAGLGVAVADHAYASMLITSTVLAGALAAAGLIALGACLARMALGHFDAVRWSAVRVATLYWAFAAAAWIVIFGVVQLLPRWLH